MKHPKNIACVFGNPIEQSKSPIIHGMFAEQCGISLDYSKRLADEDGFAQSAEDFFSNEYAMGANVTMPFKDDAMQWVDELSAQAQRAGAVNTIIKKEQTFIGDNTDGIGLVSDLRAHGVEPKSMKVLLIGAGGAAKGAVPALVDASIGSLSIYNRSTNKAQDLVDYTNSYAPDTAQLYTQGDTDFDLIINATSLSLHKQSPDLPDDIFTHSPAVYDMVYLSQPTVFLDKAQSLGCKITIDGLGMLVHQAAQSFFLWFGVKPDTASVYKYLREQAKL